MVRQFGYRQACPFDSACGPSIVRRDNRECCGRIIDRAREIPMTSATASAPTALRARAARERIAAIADAGSVAPVSDLLAAPRPSPHLARWRIPAQDDDGLATARAAIGGVPVLVAAQDERFLGGSAGANHADALRAVLHAARRERPAAVVLLMASGGVRLHEANPAEVALARALAALLDLRADGVPVIAIGVGDVFGGSSVLACATDALALLPGTKLGLSGPKVVESAHGRDELAADDAKAVAALFGAEARAAAGEATLVADDADAIRAWIRATLGAVEPFARCVAAMQGRLGERLVDAPGPRTWGDDAIADDAVAPVPRAFAGLFAAAEPVDGSPWLWRLRGHPVWLTRPAGLVTFGPREAHVLDTALLAHLAGAAEGDARTLVIVGDSLGHETTAGAERLCVSRYLAQHAAVLALLRARGVHLLGLLAGIGHSAAFFANALQAPRVFALPGSRVIAMEPPAIARVTGLDARALAAKIEDDPLVGHPIRHFAAWGGVAKILPDASPERVLALAGRE